MNTGMDVALITGASAGIGRAFAQVFARNDYDVVLVARRQEKLEAVALELQNEYAVETHVIPMDLTTARAPYRLFDEVDKRGIKPDVLVNNAGLAIMEPFTAVPPKEHREVIELNVTALTLLTRLFLPQMIDRGAGRVLNVASIASFFPTPSFAVYGATKAYVLSLSEALSQELRGTGVSVTAFCPGFTDTDMVHNALSEYGELGIEELLPSFIKMTPEECAEEGYKACMKGKTIAMDRWSNDVTAQWVKFQPRWLVRNVGGLFSRLVHG